MSAYDAAAGVVALAFALGIVVLMVLAGRKAARRRRQELNRNAPSKKSLGRKGKR